MTHTFKTDKVKYKQISKNQKGPKKTQILKILKSEIEEKILDSLNTMKYGFIFLMLMTLLPSYLSATGVYEQLISDTNIELTAQNRRIEIVLLPKLEEFFELLDPSSTI